MSNDEIKQQIAAALANGTLQPATIVLGDNVQHKIEKVEAGGIGVQINHNHNYGEGAIPVPKENDYNAVREYVQLRLQKDEDFKHHWNPLKWSERAEYLTKIFGWLVDTHSLNTNFNRHR